MNISKRKSTKGQAAILIIFVVGMVALSMGMSLSKTGYRESIMARGSVESTKAFYVANSGIEDALQRMKFLNEEELPYVYQLTVIDAGSEDGKGVAAVTIKSGTTEEADGIVTTDREIISVGKYDNFIREIRVIAQNTLIAPDFTRFIQAGDGGIEIGHGVTITSSGVDKVNVWSNSFIRGKDNGTSLGCDKTSATTNIDGNIYAYGAVEKLGANGSGPCITGNAYAGELKECRIFGEGYSDSGLSFDCPYVSCSPLDNPENCKRPEKRELPDIGVEYIKDYLEKNPKTVVWDENGGNCEIGGVNDCSSTSWDGTPIIGNIIIEGNLETRSNSSLYLSGPVWVKGDVTLESNQTISLDPANERESSTVILAGGKIIANANTHFTSEGTKFLLVATEYPNGNAFDPESICESESGNAITIEPNVQSILFYAINGCAYVAPTASQAFLGAVLAQGVLIDNNVDMIYDPALKDARFILDDEEAWKISEFTEVP